MRMIQDDGLYIVRKKLMTLDRDCALKFYQEHDGKTIDSIERYLLSETDNLAVSIYVPPSPMVSGHFLYWGFVIAVLSRDPRL